jgi:hypothetical protein
VSELFRLLLYSNFTSGITFFTWYDFDEIASSLLLVPIVSAQGLISSQAAVTLSRAQEEFQDILPANYVHRFSRGFNFMASSYHFIRIKFARLRRSDGLRCPVES